MVESENARNMALEILPVPPMVEDSVAGSGLH